MSCCCVRRPNKKDDQAKDVVKLLHATEVQGESERLDEGCPPPGTPPVPVPERAGGNNGEPPMIERSLSQSMALSKDKRYWEVDLKG